MRTYRFQINIVISVYLSRITYHVNCKIHIIGCRDGEPFCIYVSNKNVGRILFSLRVN